jgi:alkanesulfonate monooxygenase SsuD/methylene tetrahydromethanopterin reductase-like flavin-dependent oxidoreductase (luciferase family)
LGLTQAGPRLVIGVGGGSSDKEFETVGLGGLARADLVKSHVKIMNALFSDQNVSWHDEFFDFTDVTIEPRPPADAIRFWWCGSTPKAARLAASVCDGWLPGRITLRTLKARLDTMDSAAAAAQRPRPPVGIVPTTSIYSRRDDAMRSVDVDKLCRAANRSRFFLRPESGEFQTLADLEGMVLAGDPDDVAGQCARLGEAGVQTVVFDCRQDFGRWEEQMHLLGDEVIPKLR